MIVRYVVVALLAYVFDIGVFVLLVSGFHADLLWSNVSGKICTAIFGFLAHRYFTFQAKTHDALVTDALKFALVAGLNVPFSTALLYVVLLVIPFPVPGKIVADSIGVGVTLVVSRLFIFASASAPRSKSAPSAPEIADPARRRGAA